MAKIGCEAIEAHSTTLLRYSQSVTRKRNKQYSNMSETEHQQCKYTIILDFRRYAPSLQ